jgi:hypothetical protein
MFAWFRSRGAEFRLPTRSGLDASFAEMLFTAWGETDPDAALDAALALPGRASRREAFFCALNELRDSDLSRAKSLFVEHANLLDLESSPGVLNQSRFGFERTFEFIQNLPAGDQRATWLAGCLDEAELSEARDMWNASSMELRRELVAGGYRPPVKRKSPGESEAGPPDPFLAPRLADSTLTEGFDGIESLMRENAEQTGNPKDAADFMLHCGGDWAKRDLAGAFNWVERQLHGQARIDSQAQLFEAAAAADYDAARAFWETLPPSTLRAWAANHLARGAPPHRRAEAQSLVDSLSHGDRLRIQRQEDPFAAPFRDHPPAEHFKETRSQ